MPERISNVTIVGGGTAGWLSALLLNEMLNRRRAPADKVTVTLVESPNIPTVGVGEATVPNMPRTLIECGLSETAFFKACNTSFKLGVLFDNWNHDENGQPISYINPFEAPHPIDGIDVGTYYLRYGAGGLDYGRLTTAALDLLDECRGPRAFRAPDFSRDLAFAYHLDAGRFANLLRETCVSRGVVHKYDTLLDVEMAENGNVAALVLADEGRMPVEFVLDCTGFRGLIINEKLGGQFQSYSKYLPNDRAMAVQIPHTTDTIEPMTRSTALGAGWTWRVPLFNRIGTGYVYSSAHRTDDEARDEFKAWLGPAADGLEPRVIPMRIGSNRTPWIKNCVAIGLSGGFIEPLESTAIHMIDMAVRQLVVHFPDTSFPDSLRRSYNLQAARLYEEVLDLICLHYRLNNRTDTPYWIDAREQMQISDRLEENLELWRHRLPQPFDLDSSVLFGQTTYHAVLLGKRVYEMGYAAPNFGAGMPLQEDKWWEWLQQRRAYFADQADKAPDHRHLLRDIRGELSSRERRALERGDKIVVDHAEPALAESNLL